MSLAGGGEVDRREWQHPGWRWREKVSHRNMNIQTLQLRTDSFDESAATGLQSRQAGTRLKEGPDDLCIVTREMGEVEALDGERGDICMYPFKKWREVKLMQHVDYPGGHGAA